MAKEIKSVKKCILFLTLFSQIVYNYMQNKNVHQIKCTFFNFYY